MLSLCVNSHAKRMAYAGAGGWASVPVMGKVAITCYGRNDPGHCIHAPDATIELICDEKVAVRIQCHSPRADRVRRWWPVPHRR